VKRILVINPCSLYPDDSGNRKILSNICNFLREEGNEMHILCTGEKFRSNDFEVMNEKWPERLYIYQPFIYKWKLRFFRIIGFLFRNRKNLKVDDWFPPGLSREVNLIVAAHNIDLIIVNYIWLSKLMTSAAQTKNILLTHDVFTDRNLKTNDNWFSVSKQEERKGLNRADIILAVQDDEARYFRQLTSKPVFPIYGYYNVRPLSLVYSKCLLFLASDHIHNVRGLTHFISSCLPDIVKEIPEVKLIVAGGVCKHVKCAHPNVELIGSVSDLEYFYGLGNLVINPVFSGTGIKIKSMEALAFGKVVVAHSHTIEGMPFKEKLPIIVVDDSKSMALSIIECLNDMESMSFLQKEAVEYISHVNYSFRNTFMTILNGEV
jgi:glycosyltransferase involved in cell wall biosynthesis